jgi:uncharacterized protein involved in outer membrane biogenesis
VSPTSGAGMAWHAGDSDLSGDVMIDQRSKPSRLTAHLSSQHLTFADLAPLVGATPGKSGNVSRQQARTETQLEARGELFPNVPLHVERLRAMRMDVSLDARRVIAPSYLPAQSLLARVQVEDGHAVIRPLEVGFGGGKLAGELSVDAATANPVSRINLHFDGVELAAFFRGSRYFDTTDGKLKGRIVLAGNGRSLAQVMSSADGDVVLTMAGGSVSGLIHCAIGRLEFEHGLVAFDKTLMDTQKSVPHFDGEAVLKSHELRSKITADTKQFDLLNLHSPVLIAGKIRSPLHIARSQNPDTDA